MLVHAAWSPPRELRATYCQALAARKDFAPRPRVRWPHFRCSSKLAKSLSGEVGCYPTTCACIKHKARAFLVDVRSKRYAFRMIIFIDAKFTSRLAPELLALGVLMEQGAEFYAELGLYSDVGPARWAESS